MPGSPPRPNRGTRVALTDIRRPAPAGPRSTSPKTSAPTTRSRRPTADPARWRNAALLAGALMAALGELHVVLRDLSWWFFPSVFVVVVLAAAAFARGYFRNRFVPTLIGAGAGVGVLTFAYAADSAILGVIPTFATLQHFGELSIAGQYSISQQAIRATPELGIVFLMSVLLIGMALLSDLFIAFRKPAFVFLPLVVIVGIPSIVEPGLSDAFWYIITAALFLAILRIGARPSSFRASFAAGAIIIVGSLVAPVIVPGVNEDDAPTISGIQPGVNPLVNLGDNLRRGEVLLAARYQTSNSLGAYLRLATLEDFNGRQWMPNSVPLVSSHSVDHFPDPNGLTPRVGRTDEWADVEVFDMNGAWLPVPYPTTGIDDLTGDWFWDESGLSVKSSGGTGVRGQEYRAHFLDVEPTLEQLEAVPPAPAGTDSPYLELPDNMPPIIADTAAQIGAAIPTAYDRALALQAYFLSGDFHYSEDAPVEGGYDGTGADVIGVFLEQKSGYCVHYASAMALMARSLGIPARIAVGFQPGERSFDKGQTYYTVNSDDLHAWPELFFQGVGWLRFEPTPGRGSVPNYGVTAVDDPTTPENEAAPVPSVTPGAVVPDRPVEDLGGLQPGEATDANSPFGTISLIVLIVLLVIAFTPMAVRTGIRQWRYRSMRQGTDAASAAWRELRDTAHDYGWSAPETETVRDFEERLAMVLVDDREALTRLRGSVEASAYGRNASPIISVDELKAVRRAIARTIATSQRLRVAFLPPSLVARARAEDD
jgi:transglutaminase-like putative cysteine protease